MKNNTTQSFAIENLEGRMMMAADPLALAVSQVSYNGGVQVQITGTANADNINVLATSTGLKISNGKWSTALNGKFSSLVVKAGEGNDKVTIDAGIKLPTSLYGGNGNDTLIGGSGNDNLYGQAGIDQLFGMAGNDTMVNIGDAANDQSTGGAGFDSFWSDSASTEIVTDAAKDEIAGGNVHKVSNFYAFATAVSRRKTTVAKVGTNLNGENLADPTLDDASASYKNFSTNPLFSTNGPTADDIAQGYVGDCWFLSTLAATAKTNANAIRQSVVELGDGTYGVQFNQNGNTIFVRVDGDLPTSAWGGMQYARLGAQDSVWVAIMEKAYACVRGGGVANYANLDGGWMDEAFSALGKSSSQIWNVTNGDDLLNKINAELKAGKAVTMAINTPSNGAPVIGSHAYTVVAVETDAKGAKTLVLRNPWGFDGVGNDGKNDGYVRLTATQAFTSFWGVISSNVK